MNAGTIYAFSSSSTVTGGTLAANNIFNVAGATISSTIPAWLTPGLPGHAGRFDLVLTAVHDIVNAGTIHSSGNLALTAGGSISNSSVVQSAMNLSFLSGSGTITNSGVINSLANITFSTISPVDLILNNAGGHILASNGTIDLKTIGQANMAILGGEILSQVLDLKAGTGLLNVSVDSISSTVNVCARETHFYTGAGTLNLGNVDLSGDFISGHCYRHCTAQHLVRRKRFGVVKARFG